ncbi:hypothetical protein ATI61_109333 [Archangium gephyra]|uniref:Uncharacterized protein n=1 Tax=Archangium gephyra TaxID=48 RepID=A0AAC8Q1Z4_9BACT|nr:hypothetical protein [Archangium gephyra]AKI99462.1 Hypothetical protein AA314_01089 [Archangium gephyra]REG27991.1 hypothetical protein ATI61_109333 [Archangium gephyra]
MSGPKPASTTQTKPGHEGTTDSKVDGKRKVTYVFKGGAKNLNIPYAVAINGNVLAEYKDKPKRVNGAGGKIITFAEPGQKVALYLNSDAHPSYRKEPVYEVTPAELDVMVTVTEKKGKHKDSDTPTKTESKDAKSDNYTALLTGDIWLKISHKYTDTEVDALMPKGTSAEVTAAIKSIYNGLTEKKLVISTPEAGKKPAATLTVTFADSDNPKQNIVKYELLADGLPRVHPGGYAALFNAALEAGVASITMSSAWRPILGSIAHRAGLGLDVNYVAGTRMNREELRKKGAVDTTNVSDEEKKLFAEYQAAKGEEKKEAKKKWEEERDKNEPARVKAYREALAASSCVSQLFDPWFMDDNTQDAVAAKPNMQSNSNETLHAHHLHITVREPKIL